MGLLTRCMGDAEHEPVVGVLEADYLVVGAGAAGMAFTDSLMPGFHLADRSSDLKSATGPRCVSLSGLTIELMLVI